MPNDSRHEEAPIDEPTRDPKKASVHFSAASPVIIPDQQEEHEEEEEEEPEEEEEEPPSSQTPYIPRAVPAPVSTTSASALYDFTADGEDELSVTEGERLTILEKDGDEWWKCRNSKGQEGVVPASYLEVSSPVMLVYLVAEVKGIRKPTIMLREAGPSLKPLIVKQRKCKRGS